MITLVLACIAGFLALAVFGVLTARARAGGTLTYIGCLILSLITLLAGLLSIGAPPAQLTLPIGLPWIGGHVRLDALSAFFLVVVGLGSASASLFALGYGRHEDQPQRVLPFYPAFIAGLHMVVLADDAFLFLFSWELMSLASWALVLAHHREHGNARAATI